MNTISLEKRILNCSLYYEDTPNNGYLNTFTLVSDPKTCFCGM